MLTAAGCSEITGLLTSADHGTLTFRYAGAESGAFLVPWTEPARLERPHPHPHTRHVRHTVAEV